MNQKKYLKQYKKIQKIIVDRLVYTALEKDSL